VTLLTERERTISSVCADLFWRDMARPSDERIPLDRESSNALLISCLCNRHISFKKAVCLVDEMKKRTSYHDTLRMFTELTEPMIEWVMFEKPALHRYRYMADLCHRAMVIIRDQYEGDARNLWADEPSGTQLLDRVMRIKGFGNKTGTLFLRLAVLVHGVKLLDGHQSLFPSDDRHVRRVGSRLGLWDEKSPVKVINETARMLNITCPVELDALFVIGTDWCNASNPICGGFEGSEPCPLVKVCPSFK